MIGNQIYSRRSAYALLWAIVAVAPQVALFVQPASAADPFNGERLAERWCAACHVVTAGSARPMPTRRRLRKSPSGRISPRMD